MNILYTEEIHNMIQSLGKLSRDINSAIAEYTKSLQVQLDMVTNYSAFQSNGMRTQVMESFQLLESKMEKWRKLEHEKDALITRIGELRKFEKGEYTLPEGYEWGDIGESLVDTLYCDNGEWKRTRGADITDHDDIIKQSFTYIRKIGCAKHPYFPGEID